MTESLGYEKGKIHRRYWELVYNQHGPNCNECGERMILPPEYRVLNKRRSSFRERGLERALDYLRFSFGHVKAVALGGEDKLENLVGEHFWCNKEKKIGLMLSREQVDWIKPYASANIPVLLGYLG